MNFINVDLIHSKLFQISDKNLIVGIYDKQFLMLYQGSSIIILKFLQDSKNPTFKNNFIPYKSIYSYEDKYNDIFNFFSNYDYDSFLEYLPYRELYDMFLYYFRESKINIILEND